MRISADTIVAQVFKKPSSLPTASADQSTIVGVLHIAIAMAGAIALLMITIAGMKYILSQGDPQRVAKAKDTILYAVIGLALCIISYSLVSLVVRSIG